MQLKKCWDKFSRGDHLSDRELTLLIRSAQDGEAYLAARGESMALAKTRLDLNRLLDYRRGRRSKI